MLAMVAFCSAIRRRPVRLPDDRQRDNRNSTAAGLLKRPAQQAMGIAHICALQVGVS